MLPILYFEPGGKDFAKEFIVTWLKETGGSNIKFLELATGLPINILTALLNELKEEDNVTYEKCLRGVKVWRMR